MLIGSITFTAGVVVLLLTVFVLRLLIARNRRNDYLDELLVSGERFAVRVYGFKKEDVVTEESLKKAFSIFGPVYSVSLLFDIGDNNDKLLKLN
jgi:hypothetical protein